jgi:hypothetical protein
LPVPRIAALSALALNRINPDFIRIRTLALPGGAPLTGLAHNGAFPALADELVLRELQLFLEYLEGITSVVANDHIVNLLPEVEGKLPEDKDRMLQVFRRYWDLPADYRALYRLGRRLGFFSRLGDLNDPARSGCVQQIWQDNGVTPENVDAFTLELIRRYI